MPPPMPRPLPHHAPTAVPRPSPGPGRLKWRLAGGAVASLVFGALWQSDELPALPGSFEVHLVGNEPLTFAAPAAGGPSAGASEEAALRAELDAAAWAASQPGAASGGLVGAERGGVK